MALVNSGKVFVLAQNASTTSQPITWPGGPGMFTCEATWGGGTVTLQVRSSNSTWIAVGVDTTLTANGAAGFVLPSGSLIRVLIATATVVFAYVTAL